MSNEFESSHIIKNVILNNNLSYHESSHNNIHIKMHYKRVYHTVPSPEKPVLRSHKSPKTNSKIIIDLTESESEDNSINKTYTLLKHNNRFIEVTAESATQTEEYVMQKQQCATIDKDMVEKRMIDKSNTIEKRAEIATQTDTVVIENHDNQSKTRISQKNQISSEFGNDDIFNAKITIVCGYNLPMVRLNGDYVSSAPTTYVIMEDHGENILTTSSVVQQTNPVWNSEWTVMISKNKLIEVREVMVFRRFYVYHFRYYIDVVV